MATPTVSRLTQLGTRVRNVKEFGAKGDNATDDAAALQAAYDACLDGDTLYFPPGLYHLHSGLVFTSAIKKVHLEGYSVTLQFYGTGTSEVALTYGGVVGTNLVGLRVMGDIGIRNYQTNTPGHSYAWGELGALNQSVGLRLQNIEVSDMQFGYIQNFYYGVQVGGISSATVDGIYAYNKLTAHINGNKIALSPYFVKGAAVCWANLNDFVDCKCGGPTVASGNDEPYKTAKFIEVGPLAAGEYATAWTFYRSSYECSNGPQHSIDVAIGAGQQAGNFDFIDCWFESNSGGNIKVNTTISTGELRFRGFGMGSSLDFSGVASKCVIAEGLRVESSGLVEYFGSSADAPIITHRSAISGFVRYEVADAGTNTLPRALSISHITSGTPANGFGTSVDFVLQTAGAGGGTGNQSAGIMSRWRVADHATRAGFLRFSVGDSTSSAVTICDMSTDGAGNGMWGLFGNYSAKRAAYTQTYATADKTLSAYTADVESGAYTGATDGEAKLVDLNALRVAYENLRAFVEDLAGVVNAHTDDLQAYGMVG